jgi:thioredoxin 1
MFAVLMLALQILLFLQARAQQGRPVPSLEGLMIDPALSAKALLIYFWSPSCGMCREMTRLIERLRKEQQPIVSVNIDTEIVLAKRFKVRATPTLIQVRDGRQMKIVLGARSEKKVRSLLQELIA